MSAVRVCMVAPLPPPYGGIAHWTSMITSYACDRKNDVEITVIDTAPSWRSIHSLGVFLRVIGGGLQLIRDLFRLILVIRKTNFDVIHLLTSGHLSSVRDVVISYVASWFGLPLIIHVRFGRIPEIASSNSLEWRLLFWAMRRASLVIAIDNATFASLIKYLPSNKICLIPNCVDLSGLPKPRMNDSRNKTALYVGWVVPTKGVGELCQSWSIIKPEGWRLELVGSYDEAYKSELMANFPSDSVSFVGLLSHADAMTRMANCDLFVFPSYTEGFPNAVVEAMALGKPIIASNVGAIPEMLQGDAGALVNSRSVESLSAALKLLIDDAEFRQVLGARAKERALANYSIDVVFDAYVAQWNRVSKAFDE